MIELFNDRFLQVIKKESLHKLQEVFVAKEEDNTYLLFNKFFLKKISKDNVEVFKIDSDFNYNFFSIKNAVAWCVYHDIGKLYDADRILELDRKLCGITIDIYIDKKLFNKSKILDDKLLYLTKLNENKLKKEHYTKQLDFLVRESKILQIKRFNQITKT